MELKDTAPHPISEASSGSAAFSSLSYYDDSRNEKLSNETNENLLDKTNASNDNSKIDGKDSVSDDEEYESGKEDFETATEKSNYDESAGEVIGKGNCDVSSEIESLRISVLNDDDDDGGKGNTNVEGDEIVVEKDSRGGFDGKGEIIDSSEKLGVSYDEGVVESGGEIVEGTAGKVVAEEKGNSESFSFGNEGSEHEEKEVSEAAVVQTEELELIDAGDVKRTPEGDSIIESIDVDVAGPGVAVVGETKENVHNLEEKEYDVEVADPIEIGEVEDENDEEGHHEDFISDGDTDDMIFERSEAATKFFEDLERKYAEDSHTGAESSLDQSQNIDGQIMTDSEEEEGDTDDEGGGKELFDSAALAALLKAATGADPDGGNITITSQDGSRLFSVERPAGLGSSLRSLRPAPQPNRPYLFSSSTAGGGEAEGNLSEEEKQKLEKLQQIRVKFLRLVHRLGLFPEESVPAQVLYRLALLGGRQGRETFSLDAAKTMALQLETEERDDLDFSINILVLGKSGVGKSATINSIFGEEKAPIDAFQTKTASAKEIFGLVDGVNVRVIDTPGLKSSAFEQGFNRGVLSSVKKLIKKSPPDVILYVDRLDAQSRDLNDLALLKSVTASLGPTIWRNAVATLTHAASAPPDGPSGTPLSYEAFVSQRSHVLQQSISHSVGDLRMMSPSLTNPISLVENHPSCRQNREGNKILPNGQIWRPQLLLLCYSMKILSEANALAKPQDPFDHRKLFGFRARSPPLPYMLSSMLQSRPHPKLPSDGDNADSDIDLDDFSDSDQEEEDEYDQLPPFQPLKKSQLERLTKEQRTAYLEEYDYRVNLLQKKQWREELRRMREMKKKGKDDNNSTTDIGFPEEDPDSATPIAVPLPDMSLPPSFDADYPAHHYRFLEPTSQFLARPVLDSHGWDHDTGYDGVNLEHSLAIANRFPASYTVQITKDKKDFTFSLDSSVSAKHGENTSTLAGFDIQNMGRQMAYVLRAETKFRKLKKHKLAGGVSFTFLGENVIPGVKIEDQITLNKQYVLVGSAGCVKSQQDTAYGANFELQRREDDYPIGQVQSTFSMSIIKWRGDLALGFNALSQFSIGRNSKVAVRAGINNKLSGQITIKTSSSDHLSLALAAIIPAALSVYKKLWPGAEQYSIY